MLFELQEYVQEFAHWGTIKTGPELRWVIEDADKIVGDTSGRKHFRVIAVLQEYHT